MAYKEPNVKEKSITAGLGQEADNFIRELRASCARDGMDKSQWKEKLLIANNQRMGIKRYTNFPYPGAPDIPLPETDKIIKKSLPTLVLSHWNQKKLATVKVEYGVEETPEYKEKARKSEMGLNSVLRAPAMDLFRKLMLAADNSKHYGHCIFKTFECFKSRKVHKVIDLTEYPEAEELKSYRKSDLELFIADRFEFDLEDENDKATVADIIKQFRSGEEVIEFDVEEIRNYPMIEVIPPEKIDVPAYATDINSSPRVRFEYFLNRFQLERLMDSDIFLKKDLDEIPCWSGSHDVYEMDKQRNEGVTDNASGKDLWRIEEICCLYKENKKALAKRKVFTFFADVSDNERAMLQNIDFPYEYDGWFYDKHDDEIRDNRYFSSRGVPERMRAMQEMMERSLNNMIIRDEMLNTPIWEVLDTSEIMDSGVRMCPGAKVGVKQLGTEIKQLNEFSKPDTSSNMIITMLKAYTEEYLSVSDQLFRNATNSGGGKTLGEIQTGIQQNSGPLSLEVMNWNESLSKVYKKVFDICKERLGQSMYINGEEITREDFNFPAEVRANGDLEVANDQMLAQKSGFRMNILLNPALADIVNSEDRYNVVKDWLEKDGVRDPDLFCTDPKIIAQEEINKMQDQLRQMGQQAQQLQIASDAEVKKQTRLKSQQKDAESKTQASKEVRDELDTDNAQKFGEAIGDELFAAAGAGAGEQGSQEVNPTNQRML